MIDETTIEPALTEQGWAMHAEVASDQGLTLQQHLANTTVRPAQSIALNNAALLDTDSRKITREKVEMLRSVGEQLRPTEGTLIVKALLVELADALESYLPPAADRPHLRIERGDPRSFQQKLNDSL